MVLSRSLHSSVYPYRQMTKRGVERKLRTQCPPVSGRDERECQRRDVVVPGSVSQLSCTDVLLTCHLPSPPSRPNSPCLGIPPFKHRRPDGVRPTKSSNLPPVDREVTPVGVPKVQRLGIVRETEKEREPYSVSGDVDGGEGSRGLRSQEINLYTTRT